MHNATILDDTKNLVREKTAERLLYQRHYHVEAFLDDTGEGQITLYKDFLFSAYVLFELGMDR